MTTCCTCEAAPCSTRWPWRLRAAGSRTVATRHAHVHVHVHVHGMRTACARHAHGVSHGVSHACAQHVHNIHTACVRHMRGRLCVVAGSQRASMQGATPAHSVLGAAAVLRVDLPKVHLECVYVRAAACYACMCMCMYVHALRCEPPEGQGR